MIIQGSEQGRISNIDDKSDTAEMRRCLAAQGPPDIYFAPDTYPALVLQPQL